MSGERRCGRRRRSPSCCTCTRWAGAPNGSPPSWAAIAAELGGSRNTGIPKALVGDRFGPLAGGDRGEPVGRRHEPVPRLAAGRDDGVVPFPDAMAELVPAQVLPDVLDRVQL